MNTEETHSFLNNLMDVDHVIEILPGRRVTDRTTSGLYAPNLSDGELDSDDWALITGFSGQYQNSGPIMHPSEYIGGGMAEWILDTPGVYVVIVSYHRGEDIVCPISGEDCDYCDDCFPEDEVDGWALARYIPPTPREIAMAAHPAGKKVTA